MAYKATHQGTCQICGHFQKLPGDVLSKHGYTKRWGFFSGICGGAGFQPFEKSTNRIQGAIDNVKSQIACLEKFKAEVEALTDKIYVWVDIPATWENRRSSTKEYVLEVANLEFKHGDFHFVVDVNGKEKKGQTHCYGEALIKLPSGEYGYDVTHCVKVVNRTKAKRIAYNIKQMQEYVAWQEERIENWVEKDLTPISA